MENTHLAWLRIAHVIANAPSDDCVRELVASMPDRASFAKGLAAAASVFHDFAERILGAVIRSDRLSPRESAERRLAARLP
jgi:hypothetical protein